MDSAKAPLILGTAGHIDHGKSTLIRALTGVDPDRLKEEKKRGITIELGFGELTLPSGREMGIVDVPGHEKFLRQMLSGVTGVDCVLLVVAADDGVMPQTTEHLAIVDLLGVTSGVVAVTKADLVDEDWLALVEEDIRETLKGTALEQAPLVPVSATTGYGLEELIKTIDRVAQKSGRHGGNDVTRLPVDRAFTIKGAGTVVTGTLWSGELRPGDTVVLQPAGIKSRVRNVQVHDKDVAVARAGHRVAVNLADIAKDDVGRGSVLLAPDVLEPTDTLDVYYRHLGIPVSDKPLESGARVHVAHGTAEVLGRLIMIQDEQTMVAGEIKMCQLRLDEPLVARAGDRFVVRSYSPTHTMGGGTILDAHARRRRKLEPWELAYLTGKLEGDDVSALEALLGGKHVPLSFDELSRKLDCGIDNIGELAKSAQCCVFETSVGKAAATQEGLASSREAIENCVRAFHDDNPERTGLNMQELAALRPAAMEEAVLNELVEHMVKDGVLLRESGNIAHPKAGVVAKRKQAELEQRIIELLKDAGGMPPEVKNISGELGVTSQELSRALNSLALARRVIKIDKTYTFEAEVIEDLRKRTVAFLESHGPATASEIRDELNSSRKYVIPLLTYFDAKRVTIREGDLRKLP